MSIAISYNDQAASRLRFPSSLHGVNGLFHDSSESVSLHFEVAAHGAPPFVDLDEDGPDKPEDGRLAEAPRDEPCATCGLEVDALKTVGRSETVSMGRGYIEDRESLGDILVESSHQLRCGLDISLDHESKTLLCFFAAGGVADIAELSANPSTERWWSQSMSMTERTTQLTTRPR